ncbi:Oidioi.mRNA.OKI2018_I69.chr2.g4469.t1.cds [Oikopleura dioica]|uniref:Oidioi.mRNA.OKI2018_I69.chr2.g4469.t1.cds n=1 Tax=Oikopleura dioica TaxID=34765 RepID=A0ABN7T415_OIKDI|nr:Oidioi.mRNA.OKI2018_I69.chr2.g4469.t1.cds [Oikopleura dioica]
MSLFAVSENLRRVSSAPNDQSSGSANAPSHKKGQEQPARFALVEVEVKDINTEKTLCVLNRVPTTTTTRELKKLFEREFPTIYVERQSFHLDKKSKALPNKDCLSSHGLTNECVLYFKDLGPQSNWKTVFLCEFSCMILVYSIFFLLRYIRGDSYNSENDDDDQDETEGDEGENEEIFVKSADDFACLAAMIAHTFHYLRRILEVCFLHKFSGSTFAVRNIPKICIFNGIMTAWMAYIINHPQYHPPRNLQVLFASVIFLLAELGSLSIHYQLKSNFKNRTIQNPSWNPFTWLYSRVSCPNYTYELLTWISFIIMTNCGVVLILTKKKESKRNNKAMSDEIPLLPNQRETPEQRKISNNAHTRGKIVLVFIIIILFGALYLPYSNFTIIVPSYIQVFIPPTSPKMRADERYYPPPGVNFDPDEIDSSKSKEKISVFPKPAENLDPKNIENSAPKTPNPKETISLPEKPLKATKKPEENQPEQQKWTIVISYISEEMKLLNQEFLSLTNFQSCPVKFEFIFVKKEEGNDSLMIEEILPKVESETVVFKTEADILLLPELVAKKPDPKEGIVCIKDDYRIKQKKADQNPNDFVKFTFRGENLGPCRSTSRQGPFLLSKSRFLNNTITGTLLSPAITRSKPVDFISAERILPQSYKIMKPPPNFYKLEEKDYNVPPAILAHPRKTCEMNELPIFIKSAINNKKLRSFNRQIRNEYQKLIPDWKLKLYFVFGKKDAGMDLLYKELEEFDDLIIADFNDIYNNLPLKTFAAHNFLNSDYFDSCNVQWTIFHDDDSAVVYDKLINNVFKRESPDTAKFRCIFSNINPGPPIRTGKYGVNAHNFPMGYIFPAFCNGPAASFTKKASEDIFEIARTHRNGRNSFLSGFILEDVMFTGIFREIAHDKDIKMITGMAQHFASSKETNLNKQLQMVRHTVSSRG